MIEGAVQHKPQNGTLLGSVLKDAIYTSLQTSSLLREICQNIVLALPNSRSSKIIGPPSNLA